VEYLKDAVLERLAAPLQQRGSSRDDGAPLYVYLICDDLDAVPALALKGYLFEKGFEVITSLGEDRTRMLPAIIARAS
jgi:hypothetical protein